VHDGTRNTFCLFSALETSWDQHETSNADVLRKNDKKGAQNTDQVRPQKGNKKVRQNAPAGRPKMNLWDGQKITPQSVGM